MGLTSTQGFRFKLVANGEILDLYKDEEILLSDNVTGLFDLGILPSDFTRQITLPGSKKNNNFFEFVYDISVEDPYTFSTNQKVPCYFDFDGIYLSSGYIQLNKVNVYQNKFIDSYEVTIFGGLSSFGRDLKRTFLTDLTSSLSVFNHTASYENISASWGGNLFSGSIVYPLAEYGQKIQYNPQANQFGIDDTNGALCVQDFKPAIRVKEVWDACFEEFGYTYSSSFMNESWWDNVYMICNNKLRYPVFESIDLETYGLFKTAAAVGTGTDKSVAVSPANPATVLTWYNILSNPAGNLSSSLEYQIDINSRLRGELNLYFELTSTGTGSAGPQFTLTIQRKTGGTYSDFIDIPLTNINTFMDEIQVYNDTQTRTQKFELLTQWNVVKDGIYTELTPGLYRFALKQEVGTGSSNYTITLDPDGTPKSYLSVTKVNQGGDGLIMDIPSNMPFGTSGIRLIDFITSIQKKFNLVIYPDKTKLNQFIVEPFNSWYKKGNIKDFNRYIDLNDKISVTPANNLAVSNLNFGDTLDGDYISQQFQKEANRDFGKQYYVDTENYFSQGTFEVKTGVASSPIIYLSGTGISGSVTNNQVGFQAFVGAVSETGNPASGEGYIALGTQRVADAIAYANPNTSDSDSDPLNGYNSGSLSAGDTLEFFATAVGTSQMTWEFKKILNGTTTILSDQDTGSLYTYVVPASDLVNSSIIYSVNVQAESV